MCSLLYELHRWEIYKKQVTKGSHSFALNIEFILNIFDYEQQVSTLSYMH